MARRQEHGACAGCAVSPLINPQTQVNIERWHQTLKNVRREFDPLDQILILLTLINNYYLPGDLERQISAFVAHYNNARYHESLNNLIPADVYFGRAEMIFAERQRIKRERSNTDACSITCKPPKP